MLEKLKLFFNHQRYEMISLVLVFIILIAFIGCESETNSILDPTTKINRQELSAEVEHYMSLAEIRYADLDRQDEFKKVIIDNAFLYSTTGAINPLGVITTLVGIFGIGATVDNVRRRKNERGSKPANSNNTA